MAGDKSPPSVFRVIGKIALDPKMDQVLVREIPEVFVHRSKMHRRKFIDRVA